MPIILAVVAGEMNKTKKSDILKVDPRNVKVPDFGEGFHFRNANNYGDMEELKNSIKHNGIVTPLEMKRIKPEDNDGKEFEVVFGFRRMEAVLQLLAEGVDFPYVPVLTPTGNDEDRLFRLFASDTSQVHLNVVEQSEAVRLLLDKGYDVKEIQLRIGKSSAYVYNLISLSKLPKKVKDQITSGKISTNAVLEVIRTESDTEKVGARIGEAIKNAQKHSSDGKQKKATAADVKTVKPTEIKDSFEKLKEVYKTLSGEGVKNDKMDFLEVLLAKTPKSSVEQLADLVRGKKKK